MRDLIRCLAVAAAIAPNLATPPAAAVMVGNLTAVAGPPSPPSSWVNCAQPINLAWTLPSPGPTGGISAIRIYRDGTQIFILSPGDTNYYSSEGFERLFPGDSHQYEVALVNGSGVEEPDRARVTGTVPACDPAPSQIRVLLMLFDFSDWPAPVDLDPDDVHYDYFEASLSPAVYLYNSSYSQTQLYGDVTPVMRMPNPLSSLPGQCVVCVETLQEALQLAAQSVPNIDDYDRYAFMFSRINRLSAAVFITANTAQGLIHAPGYVTTFGSGVGWRQANHELGHNLGFQHASAWKCNNGVVGASLLDLDQGGCGVTAYLDHFDPMGMGATGSDNLRDFGGFNKLLAGHFGLDQVETIAASALTTSGTSFWIDRLERSSVGTKLLRIDLGDGFYYLVENRHQGPSQYFDEVDKVIVRLKAGRIFYTGSGRGSDPLALWRDGGQLFLQTSTPAFVDTYRAVGISVTATRTVGNVHQAKVVVFKPAAGCGLLGAEALPLLAALETGRRRRRHGVSELLEGS